MTLNYMTVKYISFDLDNTLVSRKFDDLIWFREIPFIYARKHGLFFEDALKIVTDEYDKYQGKTCWTNIEWWFKHFKFDLDWRNTVDEISHEIKIFPDTIPALKKLYEAKKYKLIIVSASDRKFLNRKIKLEGLEKYFFKIISTTSELNCVDKNPKTYEKILKYLGISNEEIVHIGDSLTSDYINPEAAGIKSYFLARKKIKRHKNDTKFNVEIKKAIKLKIPKERIISTLHDFVKKVK